MILGELAAVNKQTPCIYFDQCEAQDHWDEEKPTK